MSDTAAIIRLLNLYAMALDARRWDVLETIFARDARIDYFGMTWSSAASFRRDFEAAHATFSATQHVVGNHVVSVDGATATAFSYCQWRLMRPEADGGSYCGGAWYDDALICEAAAWRIKRRACGVVWTEGNPAVAGTDRPPSLQPLHVEALRGNLMSLPVTMERMR